METRDKAFTLYKKGMGCTEIAKKLGVSLNTVKSWKKRYWDAQKGAPKKRTSPHPKGASSKRTPKAPQDGNRNRVHRRAMSMQLAIMVVRRRETRMP